MSQLVLSDSTARFKAFIACPISNFCRCDTSTLPAAYRTFIESVHDVAAAECDEVFLALKRELWGRALMPAELCTPLDFREMERCDVVIAYPGDSCGVAVELGWASALRKPIILILERGVRYSPLIEGLDSIPELKVERLHVPAMGAEWTAVDLPGRLRDSIATARSRWSIRTRNVLARKEPPVLGIA